MSGMDAALYCFKVFTDSVTTGNPAACVLLASWPHTSLLQSIATKAQQVVTAFIVPVADVPHQYHIRWFSCQQEINLCGHGTLAAAALLRQLKGEGFYQFVSCYGKLSVTAYHDSLLLELPLWPIQAVELPVTFRDHQSLDCFQSRDLVLVLADVKAVQQFQPDMQLIRQLPHHALIVTAFCPPDTYVVRYFAPSIGIDEDIATGSAQCSLAPYWQIKTGLQKFQVRQLAAVPSSFVVTLLPEHLILCTQAVLLTQVSITVL
jgi:predicted PhzF superfamily epimerase YddE/YHI9